MPEEIELAIVEVLVKLGYEKVEHNLGTVWYTDADGQTWTIEARLSD